MRALTPAEIKICEAFRAALRSALARDLEEDRLELAEAQLELAHQQLQLTCKQIDFLEELRDELILTNSVLCDARRELAECDELSAVKLRSKGVE
jgi:hypothetical protein